MLLSMASKPATLDNGGLDKDSIERLRNPKPWTPSYASKEEQLSVELFVALGKSSQDTYNKVKDSIMRCFPGMELLSLYQVKKRIAEITGVVPVVTAMCPNSCLAYTGPLADDSHCRLCKAARYDDAGNNRMEFITIPVGPQLQAIWSTPEGAKALSYRRLLTEAAIRDVRANNGKIRVFEDVFHGTDYLKAHQRGDILPDDVVLMLSMDGAQLYQSKKSDVWIYIWVVLDRFPRDAIQEEICPSRWIHSGSQQPQKH